eukprot:1358551-Pleurochrysis_carterae.AAC.2
MAKSGLPCTDRLSSEKCAKEDAKDGAASVCDGVQGDATSPPAAVGQAMACDGDEVSDSSRGENGVAAGQGAGDRGSCGQHSGLHAADAEGASDGAERSTCSGDGGDGSSAGAIDADAEDKLKESGAIDAVAGASLEGRACASSSPAASDAGVATTVCTSQTCSSRFWS